MLLCVIHPKVLILMTLLDNIIVILSLVLNRTRSHEGYLLRGLPYVQIEPVTESHDMSCSIPFIYVLTQLVSYIDLT